MFSAFRRSAARDDRVAVLRQAILAIEQGGSDRMLRTEQRTQVRDFIPVAGDNVHEHRSLLFYLFGRIPDEIKSKHLMAAP